MFQRFAWELHATFVGNHHHSEPPSPQNQTSPPEATVPRFPCDDSFTAPRRQRLTCNDSRHTATSATISTRYPFITSHRDPRSHRSTLTARHRAQTAVHFDPNTPFPTHFAEVYCTLSNPRGICNHRPPIRRRHAAKRLLWSQFPPNRPRRRAATPQELEDGMLKTADTRDMPHIGSTTPVREHYTTSQPV